MFQAGHVGRYDCTGSVARQEGAKRAPDIRARRPGWGAQFLCTENHHGTGSPHVPGEKQGQILIRKSPVGCWWVRWEQGEP